jgi:mannosylfructose-phosphate synthase
VSDRVRIIRLPCGGREFLPKEYLCDHLPEWNENALRFIHHHSLEYAFINSHYWDAGLAAQHLCTALNVPHVHTPHSLGLWKKRQMETDFPDSAGEFEQRYNFTRRIEEERKLYSDCDIVIATTPPQVDLIVKDYEIPATSVRMVPPGYDDHRFYPIACVTRATSSSRSAVSHATKATTCSSKRFQCWPSAIQTPCCISLSAARRPIRMRRRSSRN